MACPLFIDFTRECITQIRYMPKNTFAYCESEKYTDCPFYILIKTELKPDWCINIPECAFYEGFGVKDFQAFVALTKKFCLCQKHKECKRFIVKNSGETPPNELLPE